jgi:hypothetical protein
MNHPIPQGITPPTPRQDKEEPDLWQEDDIPSDGPDWFQAEEGTGQAG